MAKSDSPVKVGKDVEGKKWAVNTRRNIEHLMSMKWIEKGGGDPNKVDFVELPFPQMPAAVQNGQVEVAAVTEPFIAVSKDLGLRLVANYYVEIAQRSIVAPIVAKKTWIDGNKERAQRFAEATKKGVDAKAALDFFRAESVKLDKK